MSESASERRHALALERFRARHRRSSFEVDDESDNRWLGSSPGERERENGRDLGAASPAPPTAESVPRVGTSSHLPSFSASATRAPLSATNRAESATSASLQRSFSEFLAETQSLFEWDEPRAVAEQERQLGDRQRERERQRDRQRERLWEWERELERQSERSGQDVRGRSFSSGFTRASTSSARDESLHFPPVPTLGGSSRPYLGQLGTGSNTTTNVAPTTTTTSNNQQYSYSNLNLSTFQSGLFRDSLRRNAEVDQLSFSSGPALPSENTEESRAASRLGFEDSGSEMDLDDFVRTVRDALAHDIDSGLTAFV